MERKIIAGTYTFVDEPEKLTHFRLPSNVLFDDSNGTIINYTTEPLPGISTNKFVLAVDRPNETQEYLVYAFEDTTAAGGALRVSKGWYWFDGSSMSLSAIPTPSVVFSDNCSINDELTTPEANALFTTSPIQDQPAVTTTRVLYKGKKELTMAQFEALASLDDAVDYDITDFPNGGITNAQMTAALGYSRLFEDGEIYVCSDNGTYKKGHTYQVKVTSGVKSWEDITDGLKIYLITDILNHDGIKSGTFTEEQINNIKLADILQVYCIDRDPVYKNAYKGWYPTNPAQSTINANLYFAVATEKGNYVLAINTDTRNWEVREPVSGGSQDYVPKQSEAEPVALTWTIKRDPQVSTAFGTVINFTSNGESFDIIQLGHGDPPYDFYSKITYVNSNASTDKVVFNGSNAWTSYGEEYRTITFETEPSGELLTWLQANAVPQSEVDPNTALTWMFNETLINDNNGTEYDGNITFETPEGNNWTYFSFVPSGGELIMGRPGKSLVVYDTNGWITGVNRIITFETAPVGDTWLQANAVPQGETTKTYAQVTNENGAVSIRVFENSDADLQNLSITKDGVTINGKKPLTSVQPLYKHELVIPYSFSVTDSETVNGSVMYHYLSNTGTQITNVSEIDDNFMLSGGIGKNSGSDALTWVINEKPSIPDKMFSVKFTSDNIRYNNISLSPTGDAVPGIPNVLIAYHQEDGMFDHAYEIYQGTERWGSQAYRTLTFETAPSGELLTWLQANAVPQGGASQTTVLLLNVNVTKEGSSITVEAVNASTMGYITGTVGTITDTVTQLI